MKVSRALGLARNNLARNRRGALLSALGVAIGIGCLVFFGGLGAGITDVVRTRIFPVDAATLEVVPPQVSIGSILGGGALDEDAITRLKALPGVTDAYPKMSVRVSAVSRYSGDFFGRPLRMGLELMAVGVDPRLVGQDVAAGKAFVDGGPGSPIPVLVSTRLLEIYNSSFAAQRGLPKLAPALLTGFRFPAEFGRSFVSPSGTRIDEVQLEVVGFSPRALLAGITVPLDTARRINGEHGRDTKNYSSVVLRAATPDRLPTLAAEVRKMGFEVDDADRQMAENVGAGIAVVTAAFALLSALVTLLAAVNIAHAFHAAVRERRREIGVLRAVGASRRDVLAVLLGEAAIIGVAGAIVGIVVGVAASFAIDAAAARLLPDFPFKPESFFAFDGGLLLAALVTGFAAAVFGALGPARSAANMEPALALAE